MVLLLGVLLAFSLTAGKGGGCAKPKDMGGKPPVAAKAKPGTKAHVDDKFDQLPKDKNNKHVALVKSDAELRQVYSDMIQGGKKVPPGTCKGEIHKLPDGTRIGYRTISASGGPTVDIMDGARPQRKIHIEP